VVSLENSQELKANNILNSREVDLLKILEVNWDKVSLLASLARDIKVRFRGRIISYSRKVFIPLTRLCRNACNYCGFRLNKGKIGEIYLKPKQVLSVAEAGAKAGCFEALFTLGEKPEEKYPEAEKELKSMGYSSTIEYLYDCCRLVYRRTGLLPHSNPGILTYEELKALREVNVSLGLMLENVSPRLCQPGMPHEHSPGKNPKLRLKTIEDAGRLKIAFTTGILIGLGETPFEIIRSLQAILTLNRSYHHVQEVIVQPFKAKKGTVMETFKEPSTVEVSKTVIAARLLFKGETAVQTPPNLLDKDGLNKIASVGIDDWGGISPVSIDYVNPESPWPQVNVLRKAAEAWGFKLRIRLPIYPSYVNSDFVPEVFKARVLSLTDSLGYVREE
jgi:7,8-didemethyl-8-hydroxy-5-deazariboflavin synthase CofG subunit